MTGWRGCGFRYNPAMPFQPFQRFEDLDGAAGSLSTPVIAVSALNRMAREALEAALPLLWVGGEISNLTRASSGHVYFTLKDASAQVRCAMWRNRAQLLAFRPENGMRVEARALVTLYEARGDYQLNVEALRPAGIGNLFEAFNRLKARLAAEGLFDPDQRRPLPRFPRAVGIVTSLQAAALRDVLVTLRRRAPHLPVVLYPAPVQGADAAARLVAAVRDAGRRAPQDGIDLLLLVRGGGSIEDLWSFNDEALARALRACPLPVVCGVGHETDFTIADFAADLRAPTPTGAAEIASAGWLTVNDGQSLLNAAIAGLGIAYLPSFLYYAALKEGLIEEAIPDLPVDIIGIYAVYPPGRFTQPKVRAFIDFLVAAFADKGPDLPGNRQTLILSFLKWN